MATSTMRRNQVGAFEPVASRMWDWFTTPAGLTPLSKAFGQAEAFVPPVDIYETAEEIVVAASLPSLDIDQVDIQVREDQLTISGEQRPALCFESEENATPVYNGINRYGKFSFSFRLPAAVDANQTQAKYENGMLCMRFLKAQHARAVRVTIESDAPKQIASSPAPKSSGQKRASVKS
jgi:HSP20 family protein